MFKPKKPSVEIFIPRKALEAIYDECDQFEVDETGGRVIGGYRKKGNKYEIEISGIIGPGPSAKRTATSFYQDGEYQEKIFRSVEENHPDIEHLGNWHTHHVNGLSTLSSGDRATYQRIVNHSKHNTDFFYALLVVEKLRGRGERYKVKHFFLRRNDPEIYEVPESQAHVVDEPVIWPLDHKDDRRPSDSRQEVEVNKDANRERVKDQEFFSEFYPHFKPLFSKSMGAFYWKGRLEFIDGAFADVVVLEDSGDGKPSYTVSLPGQKISQLEILSAYQERTFKSARHAILSLEKDINKEIHHKKGAVA